MLPRQEEEKAAEDKGVLGKEKDYGGTAGRVLKEDQDDRGAWGYVY